MSQSRVGEIEDK